MGSSLSTYMGYGILFLSNDEIYQEESILNAMESKGLGNIYDFFDSIIKEENKKEENPCKLSYLLVDENDFTYGVFVFQKETRVGTYDSTISFDPEKLASLEKHDEFLIRVANDLGIHDKKPGWFSVSRYS